MPNTYTDYSATANQQSFSYSFPVLLAEHVAVEINGVTKTYNTDYKVDKTTSVVTLQLGGITSAGASSGDIVRIRRKSDPATDLVDFADGSRLSASRLDLSYQHNRYLNEEASEISDGAIGETTVAGTTFLNATAREIRNLSTPTTDNSATTKRYVDNQLALSGINMTAFGQDDYTGDGAITAFTFINITPQVTDSKAFLVNIDGITQNPSSYSISDTAITFTDAPVASSKITVVTLAGAAITAPVDGVTTELTTGNKIGVKNGGIDNAKLAGSITEDKLAGSIPTSKLTGVIDDDTFTTGVSATSLASARSIKAFVQSMRPKFVPLTGGTTDLTKQDENDEATVTYNIADFTADLNTYPEFDTSKITGIVIQAETRASGLNKNNQVIVSLPDGTETLLCRTFSGAISTISALHRNGNSLTVPINAGQTSFTLTYTVGSSISERNKTIIKGAIINGTL